jgi:hypothetical protein
LLSIILHPIICRIFKLNHTLLKQLFIMNQSLHFKIWIFACVLFKYLKTFSDVLVLVLKLKYFTILFVDQFWLFLNSFSKAQITLKNLFHHIDCLNNTTGYCIFCFISSMVIAKIISVTRILHFHRLGISIFLFLPIFHSNSRILSFQFLIAL